MSKVGAAVLMPDAVFVNAAELAEIIGNDLETVNNWIRRGIINRTPIGQRSLRNRLFSKE
jgi:phage terminase Nu1 subunit (DNA packaging protein)